MKWSFYQWRYLWTNDAFFQCLVGLKNIVWTSSLWIQARSPFNKKATSMSMSPKIAFNRFEDTPTKKKNAKKPSHYKGSGLSGIWLLSNHGHANLLVHLMNIMAHWGLKSATPGTDDSAAGSLPIPNWLWMGPVMRNKESLVVVICKNKTKRKWTYLDFWTIFSKCVPAYTDYTHIL